jgi:phospholipid/cholesterol/gamma-HCH transport system substrate-binding protein
MGGKYVNLAPGGDDEILKSGDTISLTQSSVSLEGLLSKYIFSNNDKK